MFIGHYGVSFGGSAADRSIRLWVLFVAVQLLDIVWGVLVLLGVEDVRIVPGITATNPLDLYYMPYSHSLAAAILWSVAAGIAYHLWRGRGTGLRSGAIVGAAVLSHWLLDLVVHRPDLPLVGDRHKVGLALWDLPAVAFLLEIALLFGGLWLYLRATRSEVRGGATGFVVFGAAMVAIQAIVFFGAPPPSAEAAAGTALAGYVLLAVAAWWLERRGTAAKTIHSRSRSNA